jgi:phosphoenolpyruvate carboxylase
MNHRASIESQADTLLDLLIGQCDDLEKLLALSRRETEAAERRDFEEVLRVVAERATLGERLEVYHRQIAELRARLGERAEPVMRGQAVTRAVDLAHSVLAQDQVTRPLLLAAREEAMSGQRQLAHSRRGVSAYLQEGPHAPLACDQLA